MDESEVLGRLWEEYKLRQEHYWSSFNRFGFAIVTINIVPYLMPDLITQLDTMIALFPASASLLSLVCTVYLGSEYQRLRMVRKAYDDRFLLFGEIPRMPLETWWERLVARRIGSATTVLFGIGLTLFSILNLWALLKLPIVVTGDVFDALTP